MPGSARECGAGEHAGAGRGLGAREGRRTEHAPEGSAVGARLRGLCSSRHSTSGFSSDRERSGGAGQFRLAPSLTPWRPT